MEFGNVKVEWLGHAGFMIKGEKVIYIDPFKIGNTHEHADIVLITHSHYDHCSLEDLRKIVRDGTFIVMPADAQSKITKIDKKVEMKLVEPGDSVDFGIKIEVHPAYNIGKNFHPKNEGWVGYVVKIGNLVFYHAGDTDVIPEMSKLTGYGKKGNEFIALLPVGGKFTMNADEAVEAAKIIKPSIAIPMHYGEFIGTSEDAKKFVELCKSHGINAVILEKKH
ncbi:MBL fold metallo-hydrolase [Candidatus Pacearchaeota archaeon]|nr:MBL fold metallo-hydrolase [Candidatus Pacearchaeota archaeon]